MSDEKTRLANRERQRKYREAHRDDINQQRKDRYKKRISQGKCPRCGGKVKKGYTLCSECCEYQANLNRKYAQERKKTERKKTTAKSAAVKKSPAKKPVKSAGAKKTAAPKAKAKPAVKAKAAAPKAKKAVKAKAKAKK